MSALGPMPRIFISYAHADRAWLRSLVAHLRGALGSNDPEFIFFDENSLRSGDTWSDRLRQEVTARPIFIVALTPQSLASTFVRDEVQQALAETAAHPQRRFISLLVQACDPAQLSPKLLEYQITDFIQQPFNIAFPSLLGAIRSYMGAWNAQQRPPAPQPGYAPQGYPQPQPPQYPQYPQPGYALGYPPQQAPQPGYAPRPAYPPVQPGYAAPAPQGFPPVYQPTPAAPTPMAPPTPAMPPSTLPTTPPPTMPTPAPAAPAPSPAPLETERVGGGPASTPPAMTAQPALPPTPTQPSPQARQMAVDTHAAFMEQNWVEVVRRGEFALMLPDNADDARLRTEVAIGYAELKRWDKASEAIERALASAPWRSDLLLEKARMQLAFGQVDDAVVTFDSAFGFVISDLAMRRSVRQAIFTERRALLMDRQQWDEALANVEVELGESGDDLELLRIRAELLLKLGLRDEAARPFLQRRLTTWMQRLGYGLRTVRGVELVSAPMVAIPAGDFLMGSDTDVDPAANSDEEPQMSIKTAAYELGRYPVTVAEYDRYVRAGGTPPESYTASGVLYDWDKMLEHPDYPVTNISWRQALAYARWMAEITGEPWRLPTEAEWEKAARWDEEQRHARIYPWGDTYDVSRLCNSDNLGAVTRVGAFPAGASPYGLMDMAGNTWDLTSTLYRRYPYVTKDDREDLDAPGGRSSRGSGYVGSPKTHRAAARTIARPDDVDRRGGLRLAREAAPAGAQAPAGAASASAPYTPETRVAGNVSADATPASPAQRLAQEAHFAFVTGKWEDAASKGAEALGQPELASSQPLLAETTLACVALQRWQDAATWAGRALAGDPFNAEMWQALARAQRGLGQSDEAIDSYNRALAVVASDKRTLRLALLTEQRGLLMERMRWTEALSALDEEIRLTGDQERINLRAEVLRRLS